MSIVQQFDDFLKRTEPGPGMDAKDDGVSGAKMVHLKSIPNVCSHRLVRCIVCWHGSGADHDGTRRAMIEVGMHKLCILHELKLRGIEPS